MGNNLYAEKKAKKKTNGICRGKVPIYMQTDIPAHGCNMCFRLSLPTLISKHSVIPFIVHACNTDSCVRTTHMLRTRGDGTQADCWLHTCHIIGLLHRPHEPLHMARFIFFEPKGMGPDRLEDKSPSSGSSAGDSEAKHAAFTNEHYRALQTLRAADRGSIFLVSVNGGV